MALPDHILKNVCWRCGAERYADAASFAEALRTYHTDLELPYRLDEGAIALERAAVEIAFEYIDLEREEEIDDAILIHADAPEGFSALELMFKACDGIAARLDGRGALFDHCFFEGLTLDVAESATRPEGDPPRYWAYMGS